jgi:GT2 family glycosyltransferase/glycosyltransferase involved in cell wall biosynthesis
MRVCFFGTYNRDHSVNRIYRAAVADAGYEVVEIHEPLWEHTRDKDDRYFGPASLILLAFRWLRVSFRLVRRWWVSGGAPVVVVGFNGQLDILLLRLLCLRSGPRIVFCPSVSLTETLVDDREVYARGSIAHSSLAMLDRLCCRVADCIVVDTDAHRRYFRDALGVEDSKLVTCYLGADAETFAATARSEADAADDDKVDILYFGQYLPLHGLGVVAHAVEKLANDDRLRFTFIGAGAERAWFEPRIRAAGVDAVFVDWVPYDQLSARLVEADIVLGIFGSSVKARMVIPNKVYEAATVEAAIISGDTPAMREVFVDGRGAMLCEASGPSLAEAITCLAGDAGQRQRLRAEAGALMREKFSAQAVAANWKPVISGDSDRLLPEEDFTDAPRLGVVVLHYNDADAAIRCLESLDSCTYPDLDVLVVDNASRPEQKQRLEESMAGRFAARMLWLDENTGYAGGNNLAMAELFESGCAYVLLLNADTLVAPTALVALVRVAHGEQVTGPVGPRVSRDWLGAPVASLGERFWADVAWFPRTLLRYRRPRHRPYAVQGILGCAILLSERLYRRTGGFDEDFFAYYEEVDLCLRSSQAGLKPVVEPAAEVAHAGHRGFGKGMSTVSAYLKARNLWRLGYCHLEGLRLYGFIIGYAGLMAASALAYSLRGRFDVLHAMREGWRAGVEGDVGRPPHWVMKTDEPEGRLS